MTMASAAVEEEVSKARRRGAVFGHGYYRQANGWITIDVHSPMERLHYTEEGWDALPQYGFFDNTTEYTTNHPFETLFMNGGARELPLDQVIANGFNVKAPEVPSCGQSISDRHKRHTNDCLPYRKVSFPQLEGVQAEPSACRWCGVVKPTEKARNQHEQVMHHEERSEVRSGEAIATALARFMPTQDSKVIEKLKGIGLTKKQLEALAEAGIEVPEE